jgi:hypothetical protein
VDFPVSDLDTLHDFARDFVLGVDDVEPVTRRKNDFTPTAAAFLERMRQELIDAVGEQKAGKIIEWVTGWPFNEKLQFVASNVIEVFIRIRRGEEDSKSLSAVFGEATISKIDSILDRSWEKIHPIEVELDAIKTVQGDNWEYAVHYMYNRGQEKFGEKVDIKISPIDWLYGMIHTSEDCRLLCQIRPLLPPENIEAISVWFMSRKPPTLRKNFGELLAYVEQNCPENDS